MVLNRYFFLGLRLQGGRIRIQRLGLRVRRTQERPTGSASQTPGNGSLRPLQERPDLAGARHSRKQLARPEIGKSRAGNRPETF